MKKFRLGSLSNSIKTDIKNTTLLNFLKKMYLIRLVEQKLAEEKKKGNIIGPVHLCIGQEAVPTGISENLDRKKIQVFGNHRSHGHLLSLNTSLKKFFSEILGKNDGLSGGMGGSMHLIDKNKGFFGSVPIVGGTVPIAVGSALASKVKNKKCISVAYMGDSALEEGAVQESLNFASNYNLPILFVVENNFYASHMHISERQTSTDASRFATTYNIKNISVNGNNVVDVYEKSKKLLDYIKIKSKPAFLQAYTYRWLGHVDWREDIDVGITRSQKEIRLWKKKDPIKHLENFLMINRKIKENMISQIKQNILDEINKSWLAALKSAYPKNKKVLENVYK